MEFWVPIVSSLLVFFAFVLAAQSAGGAWDATTERYIADLRPALESLSIKPDRLPYFLRLWTLSMIFALFLFAQMNMIPLAIGVVYLIYVAPRLILKAIIDHRRTLLRDQMVGATVALANSCRAGLSLGQGLDEVSRESPQPLAAELRRIVTDYECGRPLPDAITDARERLQVDSFTLFSTAVMVALERGGRITDSLERISTSLQETQRLERKLAADTASGKMVVWLLTGFPFFFLALSYFLQPANTQIAFGSLVGQLILLLVMVMVYFSFRWCQKILDISL